MNTFFKDNRISLIVLLCCLVVLVVLMVATGGGIARPFITTPKVGTPMVDVGGSLKENEIISQASFSANVASTDPNDDAMSYGDFIKNYGEKRIQFDENCRATPLTSSFSVGDTLILDNRSDTIQAVKFIDDLYALPPYHVRIFKLERQGIFNIDCGSSRNVAEIIVH